MENCPECGKKLVVSLVGKLYCPDMENCGYVLRSDWLGGEEKLYRCPICLTANDPQVFAMKKMGGFWYHKICLEGAIHYFIKHFEYRLDEHLNFIYCKPRENILQRMVKKIKRKKIKQKVKIKTSD